MEKRLTWLDQLKAISMYIVVLGHSLQRVYTKGIFKFIYTFHMPLFFMISGFTFRPGKYEGIFACVKDKIIKLAYPYVMLNLLVIPLWYVNMRTGMIAADSLPRLLFGIFYSNSAIARAPSNATWFIMTLFLAEIIYYCLYFYLKDDKSVFLMSCILCVIGLIAPMGNELADAPLHLDVSFVAQFYYGCGYLLKKNFASFKDFFKKYKVCKLLIILFVGWFFGYINRNVDMSNEIYGNCIYTLISSLCISSVLFYLVSEIKIYPKILSYIGKNTIIILAFHILVLRVLQAAFPIFLSRVRYGILASWIVYALMVPIIWLVNRFLKFTVKMPKILQNQIQKI